MNKIAQAVVVAACLMGAGAAQAQLGGLGGLLGGAKSSSGGDIGASVGTFVNQSAVLGALTSQSLVAINSAFMSKEDSAVIKAELNAINKLTDPGEKNVRTKQLYESQSAETKRLLDSGDMKGRMATLDADGRKQIGNALLNFGIGGLQALELTKTGQALVGQAGANPMNLTKIMPVKDTLPLLGKVVSDSGGIIAGVVKLAQSAKIDVPKVTASSKPVDLAF
ncbi:MAG: hypothetical protein RR983_17895 [Massilia sp.]|uniref:hypothetical protein n=1 Tax=Massilia sp. TaxID=1882437 RepID=UPI002FC73994